MGLIPINEYPDMEWFDTATPLTPEELELANCEPTRRREPELTPFPAKSVQSPPHGITRTYGRRDKSARPGPKQSENRAKPKSSRRSK